MALEQRRRIGGERCHPPSRLNIGDLDHLAWKDRDRIEIVVRHEDIERHIVPAGKLPERIATLNFL